MVQKVCRKEKKKETKNVIFHRHPPTKIIFLTLSLQLGLSTQMFPKTGPPCAYLDIFNNNNVVF